MKTRLLSAILAVSMLTVMLPVSAFAEEPAVTPEPTATASPAPAEELGATASPAAPTEEEPVDTASSAPDEASAEPQTLSFGEYSLDTSDLPDDDELLTGYLESLLYSDGGIATARLAEIGPDLEKSDPLAYRIYSSLKPQIAEVAAGRQASTKFTVDIASFEIPAKQENMGLIFASIQKVWGALIFDCPYELYWFRRSVNGSGLNMAGDFDKDNKIFEKLLLDFYVNDDYKGQEVFTTNTEKTGAASAAVIEAKKVVSDNAGKTDYQKLVGYKDYICDHVSYHPTAMEDPTSIGNPFQVIYVFDNDPATMVVCEGYAKAFKYLCDLSAFTGDVVCYDVLGMMDGGTGAGMHMWNVVSIEGKNYLVDLTNTDTGSLGCCGDLFMAGTANGSLNEGYTFDIPAFHASINYKLDQTIINLFTPARLTLEKSGYVPAEQDAGAHFAREHMGENGWFTGVVWILPPQGYTIGQTEEANLSRLDITADGDVVYYLKNSASGAVSGPKTIAIKYDADKPAKPALTVSAAPSDTAVILAAAATDATSGIQNYTLTEKDNKIAAQTSADGVFTLTGLTPDTEYSFTVTAKDNAGNGSEVSDACAVTTGREAQATPTTTPAATATPAATVTSAADTTPAKFTVNAWVNVLAGGTVSPMGTTAHNQGEKLTYTITPAPGYRIVKVTVDGVDVGAVSSYTFNALNRNHEIGAYFDENAPKTTYTGTIPATGDEAPLTMWYVLAALTAAALGVLLAGRRKKIK